MPEEVIIPEGINVGGRVGAISYAIAGMNPEAAYAVKINGAKAVTITDANGMIAAGTEKPTEVRVEIVRTLAGVPETLVDELVTTQDARSLTDNAMALKAKQDAIAALALEPAKQGEYETVERKLAIKKQIAVLDAQLERINRDRKEKLTEQGILTALLTQVVTAVER